MEIYALGTLLTFSSEENIHTEYVRWSELGIMNQFQALTKGRTKQ